MKKNQIEENIRNLQKKIQELENSTNSFHQDIEEDMNTFQIPRAEPEYIRRPEPPKAQRLNKSMVPTSIIVPGPGVKASTTPFEAGLETELHRELINLKETDNQTSIKIETLNFRCEKLQNELTSNLEKINKQALELEEKANTVKKLTNQNKLLETEVESSKATLIPEHQKLKSQYAVSLLELKSLENDNGILDRRIKEIIASNTALRADNREQTSVNSKLEMERLQLKKDIEILRSTFSSTQNELNDLAERFDDLCTENERLKNELFIANQKLTIVAGSQAAQIDKISNIKHPQDDLGNMRDKMNRVTTPSAPKMKRTLASPKSSTRPNLLNDFDKLNFDGLRNLEENLKRFNK